MTVCTASLAASGEAPREPAKRSNARDGFPWTHPSNAFATEYSYTKGALPVCDDMSERAALLCIASVLTETDIANLKRSSAGYVERCEYFKAQLVRIG